MPRVQTIYDPGTAKPLEDAFVRAAPFYAVFDGVSGLYDPGVGWRDFAGRSGGQRVIDIAKQVVAAAGAVESAFEVARRINIAVREFVHNEGLSYDTADDVPGTAFALAKVHDGIEIVAGGDAYVVWRGRDGRIGATANQNYNYESALLGIVRGLMHKHGGDRAAMWREYLPLIRKRRRANTNKAGQYAALNGDPAGEELWQRHTFAPGELQTLLLVTDGMANFDETADTQVLARALLGAYDHGGVEALLARVRAIENGRNNTHIKHAEATAVAINLL